MENRLRSLNVPASVVERLMQDDDALAIMLNAVGESLLILSIDRDSDSIMLTSGAASLLRFDLLVGADDEPRYVEMNGEPAILPIVLAAVRDMTDGAADGDWGIVSGQEGVSVTVMTLDGEGDHAVA